MSNKIIKINRGDSYAFDIYLTDKEDCTIKYLLEDTIDIVYFAIMLPHQRFEDAILIQGYTTEDQDETDGKITIKLSPSDTRQLVPGIYYYTVKLQKGGSIGIVNDFDEPDEVRTIIERTKFIVNE